MTFTPERTERVAPFWAEYSYEATTLDYLSPRWYPFREPGGPDAPVIEFDSQEAAQAFVDAARENNAKADYPGAPVAYRVKGTVATREEPYVDEFLEAEFQANRSYWAGRAAAERAREAATPYKGRTVEVFKGRKVPVGTTGVSVWYGEGKWGWRVGVKDAAGEVHWTDAGNVRVVQDEQVAA